MRTSPEKRERATVMCREGWSNVQIAERIGLSVSTVAVIRKAAGIAPHPKFRVRGRRPSDPPGPLDPAIALYRAEKARRGGVARFHWLEPHYRVR